MSQLEGSPITSLCQACKIDYLIKQLKDIIKTLLLLEDGALEKYSIFDPCKLIVILSKAKDQSQNILTSRCIAHESKNCSLSYSDCSKNKTATFPDISSQIADTKNQINDALSDIDISEIDMNELFYKKSKQFVDKDSQDINQGQYETDEKDKTLIDEHDAFEKNVLKSFTKNRAFKTRHKLKAHTSKIVSSFKTPSLSCSLVKEYKGHKDGIWDISVSRLGHPLMGTASADKTARIWGVDSGRCLTLYTGHTGSVNAIAFHPTQDLVLTASGDASAHIWKAAPILPESVLSGGGMGTQSSEESPDSSEDDLYQGGVGMNSGERQCEQNRVMQLSQTVRSPITTLLGHSGVVISCAWLNEDLAVTAGWDRVANLYNVETGVLLQALTGHDSELTHVACHPTQRLVTTCSTDSTFRLWDFRESIHSVSVFQGHTESVTCAAFSRSDQIVSGSDDRSVKVWDLKNMRAPVASIQTQSAVNRLDISSTGLIAVPQDNRQIYVHDLNGHKLTRLPRDSTKSHHRMVSAVCWAPDSEPVENWRSKANLFSAGFDRMAFGWSVKPAANKEEIIKLKEKTKDGTF